MGLGVMDLRKFITLQNTVVVEEGRRTRLRKRCATQSTVTRLQQQLERGYDPFFEKTRDLTDGLCLPRGKSCCRIYANSPSGGYTKGGGCQGRIGWELRVVQAKTHVAAECRRVLRRFQRACAHAQKANLPFLLYLLIFD